MHWPGKLAQIKYADIKFSDFDSFIVLCKTCIQNIPAAFCISPARIIILNCNSVASLTLAVGVHELMFLTLSYKSYAKVINNIVNYALINTTFSPLLLVFFLLLVLDIHIYSRSASTVLSECNRRVSELLCQLSLCHLRERNIPSKLLWLG